jgi:hypothetical protein
MEGIRIVVVDVDVEGLTVVILLGGWWWMDRIVIMTIVSVLSFL